MHKQHPPVRTSSSFIATTWATAMWVATGAKDIATPHIDSLAKDGIRFTRFYTREAVCSASRAALLTGCYPNLIGIRLWDARHDRHQRRRNHLGRSCQVARLCHRHLRQVASRTTRNFLPLRHGFDEFFGLPYSNDMWPQHPERVPRPMASNEAVIPICRWSRTTKSPSPQSLPKSKPTHPLVHRTRRGLPIGRQHERPFFIFAAQWMPHVPLHVGEGFRSKSARGLYA